MKWFIWTCLAFLLAGRLLAEPAPAVPVGKVPPAAQRPPPGVEAAQALSTLTGAAISPLLGVGAVGAYKYWRTPEAARARLPWFAQRWFWVPALVLVGLVFLKDTLGAALPWVLKKPLDLLEMFEHKLSALLMAGLFVPLLSSLFQDVVDRSSLSGMGLGMVEPASLLNLLLLPLALAVFAVVFLASHAINVLVLISPFGLVDTALKAFRLVLLFSVVLTSVINPYLGGLWALLLIIISYTIAGWSLRMSVFGTVLAWDLLTFRHRRFQPGSTENWAFTARRIEAVPARSYGRLARDEQGRLVFHYRPWLVFRQRRLVLGEGTYCLGRGLVYPEVHRVVGEESEAQLLLPPRCRGHEESLTSHYQLTAPRDIGILRGLKGLRAWWRDLFTRRVKQTGPTLATG